MLLFRILRFLKDYGLLTIGALLTIIGALILMHVLHNTGKHSGIAALIIGIAVTVYSIFFRKDLHFMEN
ncbi:MAG: hypothetical protein J5I50_05420 [Chitinophagaceae bacterium]|nr:hypothetical protein [Chitinophagaceae bacterium]